jgi:hypothetical protein
MPVQLFSSQMNQVLLIFICPGFGIIPAFRLESLPMPMLMPADSGSVKYFMPVYFHCINIFHSQVSTLASIMCSEK